MTKKILALATLAAMSASATGWAQPGPVIQNGAANAQEVCAAHPEQCDAAKQKVKDQCAANPQACTNAVNKAKAGYANAQAKCAGNPAECERVRGNMEHREDRRHSRQLWRQKKEGAMPAGQ